MFERFMEQARRTLFFGRYAVTERGGASIEPEHFLPGAIHDPTGLLGILVKTQGAAFRVLHEAGVTAAELRSPLVGRSAE